MKKKIIFSTYDDKENPYYGGGGAAAIHEVAKRLTDEYDITVLTGNYPGAKNKIIDGVLYQRIGPAKLGPRVSQLVFQLFLLQQITKRSFDVWIESFTPPFSTASLQRVTRKPVIGLAHMLAGEDMKRKYKLPFPLVEYQGLKTYKYFIVLTEALKKKIERINTKAKIFLIPNGVVIPNPPAGRQGQIGAPGKNALDSHLHGNDKYILFLGRLEMNQKGLDLLLDAYQDIAEETQATLKIAGAGLPKDTRLLEEQIRARGLQNRVILIGRVTGAKKDALLRSCSVVAVPSRFETFGIVALEAMAYGKPIVSFAIEGLQWVPSSCIIRAKSFDAHQFSEHLKKVLMDTRLRERMSTAATQEAKRYSWDHITNQYRAAIAYVLQI